MMSGYFSFAIAKRIRNEENNQFSKSSCTMTSDSATTVDMPLLPLTKNQNGSKSREFDVTWRNLSYEITRGLEIELFRTKFLIYRAEDQRSSSNPTSRTILSGLNGQFRSSQLTAVVGPSGSGKTTLIECIAGIRHRKVKCYLPI